MVTGGTGYYSKFSEVVIADVPYAHIAMVRACTTTTSSALFLRDFGSVGWWSMRLVLFRDLILLEILCKPKEHISLIIYHFSLSTVREAPTMWASLFILLPFLAATTLARQDVTCFGPDEPGIVPTTYHTCYEIIKFLAHSKRMKLPIRFSRIPGLGYKLPEQWKSGNCVLQVDLDSDADDDTTTFEQIAIETGVVLLACVASPPHVGGTRYVGPKSVMNVTVFGIDVDMPAISRHSDAEGQALELPANSNLTQSHARTDQLTTAKYRKAL